ncbi:MAG: chloride channel protein [Lachnospiraceae bacterium]|nr:chloride channel protein [Lachnospiraceae bacterium]
MRRNSLVFLDWAIYGVLVGLTAGFVASVFGLLLGEITAWRMAHPQMILGLPLGGLVIVFIYYHLGEHGDKGTNLVLNSVREGGAVPWYVAVRIFAATAVTHLFGGSAGREGAALQLGGSISSTLAKLLRREKKNPTITVMCGMSAAFSALFGTPLAATLFAMEVVNVGVIYYPALVPCSFAALTASMVAGAMGVKGELFDILTVPPLEPVSAVKILILSVGCALVSILFCIALHMSHDFFHRPFWNKYASVFAAGTAVMLLTIVARSSDYMGTGMHVIEKAINGEVRPEAFILKILFTALTLGACYKGGEIVPSFFVGATFGCLAGQILGISPSLCAGVGMVSVFCGVTNCPVSSLLIAAELFGFEGIHYFLIGVGVSYMLSGYYTLYSSQNIAFGKYKAGTKLHEPE